MEMLNRAVDGAALYKDMMRKVCDVPSEPSDPAIARWNAEVDRARAEKMARKMKARNDALQAELAKAGQR